MRYRGEGNRKIAYSGVEGAFAHIAAQRIFPEDTLVPYAGFPAAYEAVMGGECDNAVLPLENSYAGEVGQVQDLLFSGSLYITDVYALRINQNLLGLPGTKAEEIGTVLSHPQALAQCEGYLRTHGFRTQNAVNTAVAAKTVAEGGDRRLAAIASRETARLYHLEILAKDINENPDNTTRFGVFSRRLGAPHRGENSTFLLLFTVKNTAGALARAVSVIGKYGFNMRVLRSRPIKDAAREYYFYVEAEGDETSLEGRRMLSELRQYCDRLKVAGHAGGERIWRERK